MRKLADSAGVSSAAPYACFKNKEAYLQAVPRGMERYSTEDIIPIGYGKSL